MLITDGGKVLRCPVNGISSMGRATQGVRVMNLSSDEKLVSIARVTEEDVAESGESVRPANPMPRPVLDTEGDAQRADEDLAADLEDDVDSADLDADLDDTDPSTPDADDTEDE